MNMNMNMHMHHRSERRGLIDVRNEATTPGEVKAIVEGLNSAFGEFRAGYDAKIKGLEAGMGELNMGQHSAEMGIGTEPTAPEAHEPPTAALYSRADIKAFYAQRAQERNESKDATLADLFRATAGLKPQSDAIRASLSEGVDGDGGYSVPSRVMPGILDAMTASSALLSAGTGIQPLKQGAKSLTAALLDSLPTAAWRKELGNVAESDPTFRSVVATPKSLACIVRVSRELLNDSPDMDRALRSAVAKAFALELDRVGLLGTGVDPEPLGLLNTVGVNALSMGVNGLALGDYAPILAGIKAILTANGPMPTAAIMAPRSLVDFGGLQATDDQPLNAPKLVQGISFGVTTQIPVADTQGTAHAASAIYLGDFRYSYFVMRESLTIQLLREAYAKTGELGFLCHVRGDFVVPYPAAFAIVRGVLPKA